MELITRIVLIEVVNYTQSHKLECPAQLKSFSFNIKLHED